VANKIREPAVAGLFYPSDAGVLKKQVQGYLQKAEPTAIFPKAMIVPHAGYIYSGPVAASAYKSLESRQNRIRRIVLLGPSHRVPFYGLALSEAQVFKTPLGDVKIDHSLDDKLLKLSFVQKSDLPHRQEHSLEVQLLFLQMLLKDFELIPLVVGEASAEEVAQVLGILWGSEDTLIVISSDLSHYHDYETARTRDQKTAQAIEKFLPEKLKQEDACGRHPIRGLLVAAKAKHLKVKRLDLRNSGDTAGSKDQVVGYGAWVFY